MESAKRLVFKATKEFTKNRQKHIIHVTAKLDDECHNKVCGFSITGDIRQMNKYGRWEDVAGGCIHEDIAKHFPYLKPYLKLHGCNYLGQPSYPEANGQYFFREEGIERAADYLRISRAEAEQLYKARYDDERTYFKYLLFKLGIVGRWKQEADEFIGFLEDKTEVKWENPYEPEEERFTLTEGYGEFDEVEALIESGYYDDENIKFRQNQKVAEILAKSLAREVEEYEKALECARMNLQVAEYIITTFGTDNFYFNAKYPKQLKFGGFYCTRMKLTMERAQEIVDNIDLSRLPDGIKFFYDGRGGKETELKKTK